MEYESRDLPGQTYVYVDRDCAMDGAEIAKAMESGFGEVFGALGKAGVAGVSMPISVYPEMPSGGAMKFRAGVMVAPEDAERTGLASDVLPRRAVTTTHVGPYAEMNRTHDALWTRMKEDGVAGGFPIWEVYVDDPGEVAPEALRTEIYCTLG